MPWPTRNSNGLITPEYSEENNPDTNLDPDWNSKPSLLKVWSSLRSLLSGNLNCFSRYEVRPLCCKEGFSHYRVNIYMRDLSTSSMVTPDKMWRTYYLITEGLNHKITFINPEVFKAG